MSDDDPTRLRRWLIDKLKQAVMATGGTNFKGLVDLTEQIIAQCANVFANAMLTRYRATGGASQQVKATCKLCEGDGVPDIDEHGKKCLRPCPECGAAPPEAGPDLKVAKVEVAQ